MKITRFAFAIAVFVPATFVTASQQPAPPVQKAPRPAIEAAVQLKPAAKPGSEGFRSALPRSSGAEARAQAREEKADKR